MTADTTEDTFAPLDDEIGLRVTALRMAVDLGSSRIDTNSGDVLKDAALFDAFIRTGATPDGDTGEWQVAKVVDLLRHADAGRVWNDGALLQGNDGVLRQGVVLHLPGRNPKDITDQVRAAETAGFLKPDERDLRRWKPTPAGHDAIDRGMF